MEQNGEIERKRRNEAEDSLRSLEAVLLLRAIASKEGDDKTAESEEFLTKTIPEWSKLDGKVRLLPFNTFALFAWVGSLF
jgi:hypothetical protein